VQEEETAITTAPDAVEDEDVQAFREIDCMQEHGINMADIIKLKQAGLATVLSILMW
jgi:hypothetical protein